MNQFRNFALALLASFTLLSCGSDDPAPAYELPESLVVWLDGKDATTATSTEWKDKSGKGNDFTFIGSPVFRNNGFSLNGSSQAIINTGLDTAVTDLTHFVVSDSIDLTGGWKYLSSFTSESRSPWSDSRTFAFAKRNSQSEMVVLHNRNTGTPITFPAHTGNLDFFGVDVTGTTMNTYANGSASSTTTISNAAINVNKMALGRHSATSSNEYLKYNVHEVLLFNKVLTLTERQQVEGYLAHKWGMASKLPSTHPYKNSAP